MNPAPLSSVPPGASYFDAVTGVSVEYDDKRFLWRFEGLGFDFFAHFTPGRLEADVSRADDGPDGFTVLLSILLGPSEQITADVFASKCLKELARYWDLFGELEGDAQ